MLALSEIVHLLFMTLFVVLIFDTYMYSCVNAIRDHYKPILAKTSKLLFYTYLFAVCIDPYFNMTKFIGLLAISNYRDDKSIFPPFPIHTIIPTLIKSRLIHYAIYGCILILDRVVEKNGI